MMLTSSYTNFADYTKALCALIRDKTCAWIKIEKPRTMYTITAYYFE